MAHAGHVVRHHAITCSTHKNTLVFNTYYTVLWRDKSVYGPLVDSRRTLVLTSAAVGNGLRSQCVTYNHSCHCARRTITTGDKIINYRLPWHISRRTLHYGFNHLNYLNNDSIVTFLTMNHCMLVSSSTSHQRPNANRSLISFSLQNLAT